MGSFLDGYDRNRDHRFGRSRIYKLCLVEILNAITSFHHAGNDAASEGKHIDVKHLLRSTASRQ